MFASWRVVARSATALMIIGAVCSTASATDAAGGAAINCKTAGRQSLLGEGTLFRWLVSPEASGGPVVDEPLVTDRPDFTEASVTVGRGVLQIESGYTFVQDDVA